ncbi:right-handed parallel beta-helix repeat-containing protein [Glutamicibacter sp. JC586]|uniref:right-handed parallel beta-helix repeat-containing protein n=1 Tax=Glutamicibacter sp. JC586 TaxID=2590552 RepID=UPI00135B70B7|nr:right-handed parallel beta-helix repeat-containing protein [Glutamicibacter sp. JC586]
MSQHTTARRPFSPSRRTATYTLAAVCAVLAGTLAPVTAEAATTTFVADSMNRQVTSGWGTSSNGTAYSTNVGDAFSVNGAQGLMKLVPGKQRYAATAVKASDVQSGVDVSFDSLPSAGSTYAQFGARHSPTGEYTTSLRLESSGRLSVEISRTVSGTKNVLASKVISQAAKPGMAYHVDFQVTGTTTVVLKARAYAAGTSAPSWQVQAQDTSTTRIATQGNLVLGGYLSSSATTNSGLHFDNFVASSATASEFTPPPLPSPAPVAPIAPMPEENAAPAIPSSALYVSPTGSDASTGTASAPLKTISKAIAKATNGQTIVVRGGSYHESVTIPSGKTVHLRQYSGETVWLDGSSAVTGFTASGAAWVKSGWNYDFDTSPTYTRGAKDNTAEGWGFINPSYPMAAHPDQVWIDGARQIQVASLSQLKAGTFYVDRTNDKLYLGTNPSGKSVRASTLVKALSIRGDQSSVSGINVRKYAPSVPDMGAVTAEKPGIKLENLTIEDSATTGLNISAVKNSVYNVKILRSGMLGMNATYADGLVVNKLTATGNNIERFNTSPVSGGAKIARSRDITVKNSTFNNNYGPGLWLDESAYDSKIVNNDMIGNSGHGLSLEISAKSVIANNRIVNNAGFGIKLNNSSDVSIWNNTISGKNRVLNIVQDARRAANKSDPGHDPRQPFPDSTMTWINKNIQIKNNVLSNTGGGNAIVAVEDYSGTYNAEQMNISLASNAYHRTSSTNPQWSMVWSRGAGNPSVYTTLAAFTSAKAQDKNSFELTAAAVLTDSNDPNSAVTSRHGSATALPSNIATLTGQTAGSRRIGNYPR